MKLYSWNVNGIRAVHRKGLFLSFLEKHQPDILCLQETKAERGQVEIDLAGYSEYWNSAVKKGYSGTAIFSKHAPIVVTNGYPEAFAKRFSFADELQRDSRGRGAGGYGGVREVLRGDRVHPECEGRPFAPQLTIQALGSGVSCLLQNCSRKRSP
jgi:hypothetical protein